MTEEQIKIGEELLEFLIKNNGQAVQRGCLDYIKSLHSGIENNFINAIITMMIVDYKVINRHHQRLDLYIISRHGIKAKKIGLKKFINEFEEKERFEFKTSKWKYYTFWWWFGLAVLGGGYSIYDIIERLSTTKTPNQEQISTTTLKESEEEKQKSQSTLILDQKNPDSLHNSKTPSDSLTIN